MQIMLGCLKNPFHIHGEIMGGIASENLTWLLGQVILHCD